MRTTIEISDDLMDEAMKITGAKTKSQLVNDALLEKIQRIKRQRLLSFKGKIDLNIDLDVTRKR